MPDILEKKKKGNFEISTRQQGHPSDVAVITPRFDKDGKLDRTVSWFDEDTQKRMELEKETEGLAESEDSPKLKRTKIDASEGELRYMKPAIKEILEMEDPSDEQLDMARVLALTDLSKEEGIQRIAARQLEIVEAAIKARALGKKNKGQYKNKDGYVVGLFEVG